MGALWMREVSTGRSSSLSPLTTPFFPTRRSEGRSKALRWMEDSSDSDFNGASRVGQSSYIEAACRAIEVTALPSHAVSCEGECSISCSIVITRKRRHYRYRRAWTGDTKGHLAASPHLAARAPTH